MIPQDLPAMIAPLPVQVPDDWIYRRLGRNRHLAEISPEQRRRFERLITEAKSWCRCAGVWTLVPIVDNDGTVVTLDEGDTLTSPPLAKLLSGCPALIMFAATVGSGLGEKIAGAVAAGQGAEALIYDAVGSEMADAAVGWIQDYARIQLKRQGKQVAERRFSPGYGELSLEHQAIFFRRLGLERLGINISEHWIMTPEKSVTAVAGVYAPLE